MVKEDRQGEILSFQVQRAISNLCKNFLTVLEDLQEEYDRYFDKSQAERNELAGIRKLLPPDQFLSDDHFNYLRKRVLDKGGDVTRELFEELGKYDVRLLTNEELQEQGGGKTE